MLHRQPPGRRGKARVNGWAGYDNDNEAWLRRVRLAALVVQPFLSAMEKRKRLEAQQCDGLNKDFAAARPSHGHQSGSAGRAGRAGWPRSSCWGYCWSPMYFPEDKIRRREGRAVGPVPAAGADSTCNPAAVGSLPWHGLRSGADAAVACLGHGSEPPC